MGKAVIKKPYSKPAKPSDKATKPVKDEAIITKVIQVYKSAPIDKASKPYQKTFSKGGSDSYKKKPRQEVVAKEVDPNRTKSSLRRELKSDLKAKRNPESEKTKDYFRKYNDLINVSKEGRDPASLVDDILALIDLATLSEFIVSHSGSRVIQACLKHGNDAQRTRIVDALCENIFASVQANSYSLLAIEKLISYGILVDKKALVSKLIEPLTSDRKKVTKLYHHRVGSKFLDYIFCHKDLPSSTKKALVTILTTSPHSDFHMTASPEKLKAFYMETLRKTVDKELLALPLCHRIWKDILDQYPADTAFLADVIGLVPGEALASFLGTRDGTSAFIRLLGVAQAKEKKTVIKELKGRYPEIASNSVCCSALLRLLEATDDTVLTGKSLFSELSADFGEILFNQFGRIPFLFCLEGCQLKTVKYYPEPYRTLFATAPVTSAMKSAEAKSKELVAKFLPALMAYVKANFYDVSRDQNARDVAIEVLKVADVLTINEAANTLVQRGVIGPHQVTVLLVSLRDEKISSQMLKALTSALKPKLSAELCLSRWAFVLLELAKKSGSFRASLKAVPGLKEALEAAKDAENLAGAKSLFEYISTAPESAEEEAVVEEDGEEDDGLVMMEE